MASISDVAKKAKVAKSTVSHVINHTGYVSETTRMKVEAAIKELDYRPSQLGRNLSKNRTDLIGIIIPDISHPFFGAFVKYTEDALYQKGYKTMICSTLDRENLEEEFLEMLRSRTMDGIIMGAHSLKQEEYRKLGQPVVAFDRFLGDEIPLIQADHESGGRMAAEAFAEKGCQFVVQLVGAQVVDSPARAYHETFKQILEERGIHTESIEMGHNAFRETDFREMARQTFERYPEVDGIMGADLYALACLGEARRREISVPGQLKVAAYDGTAVTRLGERQISAVVQPIREMSRACAEMMDCLVRQKEIDGMRRIFPVSWQDGETI
ncbi:LacI family DNA-binding transcriptional regulator [Roseburia hominis]